MARIPEDELERLKREVPLAALAESRRRHTKGGDYVQRSHDSLLVR